MPPADKSDFINFVTGGEEQIAGSQGGEMEERKQITSLSRGHKNIIMFIENVKTT